MVTFRFGDVIIFFQTSKKDSLSPDNITKTQNGGGEEGTGFLEIFKIRIQAIIKTSIG